MLYWIHVSVWFNPRTGPKNHKPIHELSICFFLNREKKKRTVRSGLVRSFSFLTPRDVKWKELKLLNLFFCPSPFSVSKHGDDFLVFFLRFQVLCHKGLLCSICPHLLFHVWCPCLLAYITLLLDRSICSHNEAPNYAHDQVQIPPLQYWKAGQLQLIFNASPIYVFYLHVVA